MRTAVLLLVALVASLALFASPAAAGRQFPETGYSVTNDRILDYFDHRGGARVLGYPISREFDFMGTRVQFFQRAVLQVQANGSVGLLNLLDEGLLPYNRINGSTFPAIDREVVQASPPVSNLGYASMALEFVRLNAPDQWDGMKTNFYTTFANTVTYQEAFPTGGGEAGLMPLINLEIWGLPTSRPTYDPNNRNFVYLRFQRGIMHYDRTTGLTQGILLGDYLKSVLTGQNLPGDLDQQAQGGRLIRQYNNLSINGLARANELPATNMFAGFERDGVWVPTPVPATPTPVPPTPVPATPVPQAPPSLQLFGSPDFVEQVNAALDKLSSRSPYNHGIVRQNVWRIEEAPSPPSTDLAGRTLRIDYASAFPSEWGDYKDNQREWLAGLIVHNAIHIAQYHRGAATTGAEAEREALLRQQDAMAGIETTNPGGQFWKYMQEALDNNTGWFGCWQPLRGPQPRD